MRTQSQPRQLSLRNCQKKRQLLPSHLALNLNKVKAKFPTYRMRAYDPLFYQETQPPTLCPFTAGMLLSLTECTRWGLELMSSILREGIISGSQMKLPPTLENWTNISPEVPILTTSPVKSE